MRYVTTLSAREDESFCFFLQKEALACLLRAAAPQPARCSFLKKRTKKLSSAGR
jgi:hypothetical protein